jgi:hypothetical protein
MYNVAKIEQQARDMASKAKPGFIKINDKLYTFEFCQTEWVYRVYENGFWLVNFNCKSLPKAKKMLQDWLNN